MAIYRIPQMPVPISIWRYSNWAGTVPPVGAADVTAIANLTPGRRTYEAGINPTSYLLLLKATDIRYSESGIWGVWPPTDPDLVEVPTGSGVYYTVADTERVGLLFANEHMEAAIVKQPTAVAPPPPSGLSVINALAFGSASLAPDASVPVGIADSTIHSCGFVAVALLRSGSGVPTITVTDSVNGSYATGTAYNYGNLWMKTFWRPDIAGGPSTLTVACVGGAVFACVYCEMPGLSVSSPNFSDTVDHGSGTIPSVPPLAYPSPCIAIGAVASYNSGGWAYLDMNAPSTFVDSYLGVPGGPNIAVAKVVEPTLAWHPIVNPYDPNDWVMSELIFIP